MRRARLKEVKLPEFDIPRDLPELSPSLYAARRERLETSMRKADIDVLVVYGDREHAANMAWLSGFDPRFEEALLVLRIGHQPCIITGPENQGMAAASPLRPRTILYPPMGLMGQDRTKTPPLDELLRDAGIASGAKTGVCGWKYFGALEGDHGQQWLEIPSYIADTLRQLSSQLFNAGALFMDPQTGLRAGVELEELVRFEFAACHTSQAVKRVVTGTRPGMREFDAAAMLQPIGLPLSCHAMFSSGPRAWFGLPSPTSKIVALGEPVTTAYGVQGALNCRAGWLATGPQDLPENARDYLERLAFPYFEAVAWWLGTVAIGVRGGDIHAGIMKRLGDPFFGVALNPGHLIHLDEWMHSPIARESNQPLLSGMALQVDIIPATGSPLFTINVEDGIALLDGEGRARLKAEHPAVWSRIEARRDFMQSELGIALHPEVLPLSNIPAWLPPFWLSPGQALSMA
ncbi:MAG: aminopeptidase P family N-terminal domain-containing protein [Rhizobiaceae bacterium]